MDNPIAGPSSAKDPVSVKKNFGPMEHKKPNQPNAGVKLYNLLLLIIDILFLMIKWTYYTLESIYLFIKPMEEKDVTNDIVLITGSGHGIGQQLALKYGALGATVVCWDINEKLNLETVQQIKTNGGKAHGYTVDVTNRDTVLETGKKVTQEVGQVTILLNNAGIMPQHPILKHSEKEIKLIFEINVIAHFWMYQAFLPGMVEKNRGHIVSMSSMAGLCGLNNLVPYCGSKFAVRGIMESMQQEMRLHNPDHQIKFTTIYPFMVDTGLCKKVHIRFESFMRLVTPPEAADAIISAQRTNLEEVSIPRYLFHLNKFVRLFPTKAADLIRDFFDAGVASDM